MGSKCYSRRKEGLVLKVAVWSSGLSWHFRSAKMLPEKLFFHIKLLFCMVVVVTEGKRRKMHNRKHADDPDTGGPATPEVGPTFNMCDIHTPEVIYCYCDVLELNAAEEGNCWIFNDTSENEEIWEGFASQTRIKRLTLHLRPDGTLNTIPTVAIMQLPEIETFEVQYATFKTVRAFSFGNSTTLTKVSLSRNSISTLARNAFTHLPSLDTLSLGENQISEVNRHVFVDLPRLTKLYMDRNNITIIHDRAFQGLHSLLKLHLFSNQIQVITPETFQGLQSLERLDLHKNRIEVIGDKTFRDLQRLKALDLEQNSLKYIAPKAFHGLADLRLLNLQDNKLLSLGSDVFQPTASLLTLDIRENVLETITRQTVEPILTNLANETMHFFLQGNNLRCDQRLSWMFALRNSTRSASVRRSLDEVICYLEGATLPPRLVDLDTVTPAYETTTQGIGPVTKLLALRESELPDPNMRWMQTIDPDCKEEEEGGAGVKEGSEEPSNTHVDGGRNSGRWGSQARSSSSQKHANQRNNKAQNNMAPVDAQFEPVRGITLSNNQLASVQESRAQGSGARALRVDRVGPLRLLLLVLLLVPNAWSH